MARKTSTIMQIIMISAFVVLSAAQSCTQGNGILKLLQLDTCRDNLAIVECLSKIQLSTTAQCSIQLQPNLKIAADGTFCEVSKGVLSKGVASGKYNMGRSGIEFQVFNPNSPAAPGMLVMNLKGRVIPDAGGRETQLDCNLLFNVTAGAALGIVSLGTDSLMSTTLPPSYTAGMAAGSGSLQESSLAQQRNGMAYSQQQPGVMSNGMMSNGMMSNGMMSNGMSNGMAMGLSAQQMGQQGGMMANEFSAMGMQGMPGQQPGSVSHGHTYQQATSAAAAAAMVKSASVVLAVAALALLL